MWTDGWVMSKSTHKIHQIFVPNCFLYLIMPKNSIFRPSVKIKCAPSPRPHPQSDHIINTHMYGFVLGPLQFQSTGQNAHLTSKAIIWLCWLSRKNQHTPSLKTEPNLRKANSRTFATRLCDDTRLPEWLSAFPAHSQTSKPTQASFAHTIANQHIQRAIKSF